ncbi:hypothetical protein [Tropicimonas aquimaris]|uniref:DUF2336 domain-containing protein n=1 Tax=Tropicimonas aquimaris TaxID=914152 RepID=A0ABW3IWE7_9RHOB
MQAPNPPLLGFRALQAIMDLRAAAGRQPQAAIRGIVAHLPPGDRERGADARTLSRVILRQGCRLETADDLPLRDALLLTATQPERDLRAFACATAVLLADRLQDGLGHDDLGSYWDAFRTVYFAMEPADRAAIVQGFLTGSAIGRVRCADLPPPEMRVTLGLDALRRDLIGLSRTEATALAEAVERTLPGNGAEPALRHLHALLAGISVEPLTGDSPLFPPLLALASYSETPLLAAATALLLSEALMTSDDEGWFGITLWSEMAPVWLALPETEGRAILGGLRHLYETDPHWVPMPQIHASPENAGRLPLLPVLDTSYQPRRPDGADGRPRL